MRGRVKPVTLVTQNDDRIELDDLTAPMFLAYIPSDCLQSHLFFTSKHLHVNTCCISCQPDALG